MTKSKRKVVAVSQAPSTSVARSSMVICKHEFEHSTGLREDQNVSLNRGTGRWQAWNKNLSIPESVWKPRTLSLKEHIRHCEAMADTRVNGASTSSGTADSKPPSFWTIDHQVASRSPSYDPQKDRIRPLDAGGMMRKWVPARPRLPECDVDMEPAVEVPPCLETGVQNELECRMREALKRLQRAQAAEYAQAEEALQAQKNVVLEQYAQLDKVGLRLGKMCRSEKVKSRNEYSRAIHRLTEQYTKALEQLKVFDSMLAISNGFSQVSEAFRREFFN